MLQVCSNELSTSKSLVPVTGTLQVKSYEMNVNNSDQVLLTPSLQQDLFQRH
jgi:hypothetical protein